MMHRKYSIEMLNNKEFEILNALLETKGTSQRAIAKSTGLSLGTVNSTIKKLQDKDFVAGFKDGGSVFITDDGKKALDPYRVDNAIILAAGMSTRFAPISYEKPKGLLKVRDEVLIERQVRQLQEAGISDITVVTGYKKEQYFYLEDALGVRIAINEEYAERNNHSSLKAVESLLRNTYICSSDIYYESNPFRRYEWKAFYAAQYEYEKTEEWCITAGAGKRITEVKIGGENSWYMIGHAYFDQQFSNQFIKILNKEYNNPKTKDKLWEQLYIDHIKEFDMSLKSYEGGIHEFDSLAELKEFDPDFLENVDSEVFTNIENTLGCDRSEITDIFPLKQGITNLSCHFKVNNNEYVYRHPGVGTDQLVNRDSEAEIQEIARKLGLDDTFIHEDAQSGWKISRFIADCEAPDVKDDEQLDQMMQLARKLHDSGYVVDATFDFYKESCRYEELLGGRAAIEIPGYMSIAKRIDQLHEYVSRDETMICLSHNDFWPMNILKDSNNKMYLIDWEYAGMSDYASDFGTFVVESQLDEEDATRALRFYYGREPSLEELRHNFAYAAFAGWCWYVWSLYKEAQGELVGKWLHIYYRFGKDYLDKALKLYQQA